MDIDTMEAGREMDALVAEKVMGWRDIRCHQGGNLPFGVPDDDFNRDVDEHKKHGNCGFPMEYHREPIPMFSNDISAAWEVVEKLLDKNLHLILRDQAENGYSADFYLAQDWPNPPCKFIAEYVRGDTAPLAICRAALKAAEGK